MKEKIVKQRVLTAEEGMVLTDGQTYGKTVAVPAEADYSVWQEIDETEIPEEEEVIEN